MLFRSEKGGWKVTALRLDVRARVPDADADAFQRAAETAKSDCPLSVLFNAPITLTAVLE